MKKKLLFILPICLLVLGFSAIQTNANEVVDLDAVSSPQANQEIALDNLDGVDIKPSSIQGHKISAAKSGTGALMDYYDGIESNYFDFLLYYISQNQNDDGSFGINNTYEISTDIAFALNKTGKNSGIQYTNLIDYLVDSEVSNIRDMASKARVLFATGGNWQLVMDDIITQRNNFGWGIYPGYGVDLQTTMEVAYASHVTQYDPSNIIAGSLYITLENIPQDGALAYDGEANASYYLINKMLKYLKPFQGLSVSDNGITYYVNDGIASLQSYLETNYISDETSLLDTDDIIDQIMTYQTWQEYETQPIFQSELKGDFLNFQKTNGSFDNSIKTTYYALDSLGQPDLEITNITSTSSLINKETAIFEIGIDNNGYAGADDAVIHLFIDNFNPQWEIDLSASSVVIEPGHSVNISVSLPTTVSLMGDTDIKVYVENSDDIDYEDNWLNESFNFAAALDSSPALPVYYIAQDYNDAGQAGLNVRWLVKEDPSRSWYVILYKESGTSTWNQAWVDNTLNGIFWTNPYFVEGTVYDVTVGSIDLSETTVTYFGNDITQVQVSASDDVYTSSATGTVTENINPAAYINTFAYGMSDKTNDVGEFEYLDENNGSTAGYVSVDWYDPIKTKIQMPVGQTTSGVRLFTKLVDDDEVPVISNVDVRWEEDFIFRNQDNEAIQIAGSDNIGLDYGEYYLYDPAIDDWTYLATLSFEGSSAQNYEWYVPSQYLGTGYKVKGILYDHVGNASVPVEWGPFEIIDGTDPTGTVEVQNIQNNEWSLGDEETITWDIQSVSDLVEIDSVVLYYGTTMTLASNLAPETTTFDYTIPFNSGYVSDEAYVKIHTHDVNGNEADIYSETFNIVDNTAPPTPPFGIPQETGQSERLKAMFENTDGTREAIYYEYVGNDRQIVYQRYDGSVWETPIILKQETDVDYGGFKVVQDLFGDIHIVYIREIKTGVYEEESNSAEINYLHIANGNLVTDRLLSNTGMNMGADSAYINISPAGEVHALWKQGRNYVTGTGDFVISYISGDGLGSWSSIEEIYSHYSRNFSIDFDGNDPVVAITSYGQFQFIKKTTGTWSDILYVTNRSFEKIALDVYTDDVAKYNLIVEQDPQVTDNYKWLDSIESHLDLENILVANNFIKQEEILNVWYQTGYGSNTMASELYKTTGNDYDLFYEQNSKLKKANFTVDFVNNTAVLNNLSSLVEIETNESMKAYDIVEKQPGVYHMFYIKDEANDKNYAYYYLLENGNKYFESILVRKTMSVDGTNIFGSIEGDVVTAFFGSYIGGQFEMLSNVGDFTNYSGYRIDYVTPTYLEQVVGQDITLEWAATGGVIDDYDVYLGTDKYNMDLVAEDVTSTAIAVLGLELNEDYYWQVVVNNGDQEIYGNQWHFIGPNQIIVPETPEAVTNLSLTSAVDNIKLDWDSYTDPLFDHFSIYRAENNTTPLDQLTPLFETDDSSYIYFEDLTPTLGTDYYYTVIVTSTDDITSPHTWSGPESLLGTPEAVTNLSLTSAVDNIRLDWDSYTDPLFDHFSIYRAENNTTPLDQLTPLFETDDSSYIYFEDLTPILGTDYYYTILATSVDGVASEYDWVGPEELLVVVNDNYSLAFDGVNDVVNTQFLLNQEQNTSGYTFEAWVYPTSTSSGRHMVMSTDDGGFDWSILRQGNKWYVFTGSGSFDTGFLVDLNTWQHVAATFDPVNGVTFYKDGQASVVTTLAFDTVSNPVTLGDNPGRWDAYFEGRIDEARVWYTIKTPAEIMANKDNELTGTEPGLGAYWNLNEGEGQTAADITGAYDGTLGFTQLAENTDPIWQNNGFLETSELEENHSLLFDGIDDVVATELRLDEDVTTPGYTFEAWVYPTSDSSGRHMVISTDNGGFDWSILRQSGVWYVFTGSRSQNTGFSVDLNTWQHIAATFDPVNGVTFYKNGQASAIYQISHDISSNHVSVGDNPGRWDAYFEGRIDEARVWQGLKTEQEILDNMDIRLASIETGLLANWSFDEGNGQFVRDLTGNFHANLGLGSAIETADPAWDLNGYLEESEIDYANSLLFDGQDDVVNTQLWLNQEQNTSGYTFEAWVYPTSDSSGRHHVIGTDDGGFDWSILRRGDKWKVFTGSRSFDTGFTVDLNTWQHVAATFDPINGVTFYKNGQASGTSLLGYDTISNPITIGDNPGRWDEYFEGMIDDVRIWYTLKTSAEILASMNSELIGTEPGLGAYWNFNEGTGQTAADITGAYMATLGFTTQVESTDPSWNTRGFLE